MTANMRSNYGKTPTAHHSQTNANIAITLRHYVNVRKFF